jgi:hypothetical protein
MWALSCFLLVIRSVRRLRRRCHAQIATIGPRGVLMRINSIPIDRSQGRCSIIQERESASSAELRPHDLISVKTALFGFLHSDAGGQ